jgi:hypothetical protein
VITVTAYSDLDVIKALFAYDAKGGRLTGLRRFIDATFPGITQKQINRCMEVPYPDSWVTLRSKRR